MLSLPSRIYERGGALAVALLLIFLAGPAFGAPRQLVVLADRLNVRQQPSRSAEVLWSMPRGEVADVVRTLSGWALIEARGKKGYVATTKGLTRTFKAKGPTLKKLKKKVALPTTESGAKEELAKVRKAQEKTKETLAKVTEKERRVVRELNRLNASLSKARKKERGLRKNLDAAEKRVRGALARRRDVERKAEACQRDLMARLVASYKLSHMGEMNTFASAGNFHEMMVKQKALARILEQDGELMARYNTLIAQGIEAEKSLAVERDALAEVLGEHEKVLAKVQKAHGERRRILASIQKKKVLSLAAMAEMREAERALSLRLKRLVKDRKEREHQNRFVALKGLLKYPVTGRIVTSFGPQKDSRFNVKTFSNGISIRTVRGEPVHAVVAGEVLFADWVSGYGNLLILSHGANWYTLYAHVDELFKKKGDTVESREVIATVGDSGLSGKPDLYFEVRHHSTPENPLSWFRN